MGDLGREESDRLLDLRLASRRLDASVERDHFGKGGNVLWSMAHTYWIVIALVVVGLCDLEEGCMGALEAIDSDRG